MTPKKGEGAPRRPHRHRGPAGATGSRLGPRSGHPDGHAHPVRQHRLRNRRRRYSGDNGAAASATLALPSAVAYDKNGNLYIADSNNHVVREVSTTGTITTIAGTGIDGFSGDGAAATSAQLDTPTGIAVDANGNIYIADSHNQRVRGGTLPTIAFGSTAVGVPSALRSVTLANTGSASLTVSTLTFAGTFTTATGGTCSATPITLGPGANCTEFLEYLPTGVGGGTGSLVYSGTGVVPRSCSLPAQQPRPQPQSN